LHEYVETLVTYYTSQSKSIAYVSTPGSSCCFSCSP